MTKSKARWCAEKTQNLIILYYLGLSSQELSLIFHTSPGALQKKLDRLCVKPNSIMQKFGYDPKEDAFEIQRQLPTSISIQDMEYTLQKCKQCLEITESTNHENLIKCLVTHFPLVHKKKRISGQHTTLMKHDDKNSCSEQWKSMKDICQFLNTHHVYPKALTLGKYRQAKKMGFSHSLNNRLVRPGQLLVTANKINESKNKPVFYLKDFTEY